jgi:glyoxylase-like metal-dependent hydrolase (beta-lactamase superfamily II)/8-oxo-dGTP pyrophosphatase MutT (NUDIX family)
LSEGSITKAASVLLYRHDQGPEIFVVKRSASLRFFGNFLAFPGGKLSRADAGIKVGRPNCGNDQSFRAEVVAAVRELFEETGVLLARDTSGNFPPQSTELDTLRGQLISGSVSFGQVLEKLELAIWPDDLNPIGNLVTPEFAAIRFDTAFFVAKCPPAQTAAVWPGELDEGCWLSAKEALERWIRGHCLISPPTLLMLDALRSCPADNMISRLVPALRSAHDDGLPVIPLSPEVLVLPLRTQALPPSTHTNAYLIGRERAYLLDPGPKEQAERDRLFAFLDKRVAAGTHIEAIVLSHHHPDHVGAAAACAARYGLPVVAHEWTAKALRDRIGVTRIIQDGDRLDMGTAPDGHHPWYLEAIFSPGHAPGHLVFYEPHYRLLFAGDMVSTQTSIVIAPPEGDLTVYLESLEKLRAIPSRLLLPAHGSASARPSVMLQECRNHREKREEMLLAALAGQPRRIQELAADLYKGVPKHLMRLAELQLQAGLEKLRKEGKAVSVEDGEGCSWQGLGPRLKTDRAN